MIDKEKITLIMTTLDFEIKDDYTTWTKDNITIHFNDDLVFNPQVSLMLYMSEGDYRIDFTPAELTGIYCVAQILGICKGRSERFEEAEEAIEELQQLQSRYDELMNLQCEIVDELKGANRENAELKRHIAFLEQTINTMSILTEHLSFDW